MKNLFEILIYKLIYFIKYIFVCLFSTKESRRNFRKQQKMLMPKFGDKPIKYGNENQIQIIWQDNKTTTNPKYINNLSISFWGKNNKIKLYAPIVFYPSYISAYDDCNITIRTSPQMKIKLCAYKNSTVDIGENVQIGSAFIQMMNEKGTSLEIKKNAVLATDIKIWTTDTHSIYDKNSNKLLNAGKNKVVLGEHCWICDGAVLLKNAQIPDESIVGNSSVVTSAFDTPNIVIAGNPAKIVKQNIYWTGGSIN